MSIGPAGDAIRGAAAGLECHPLGLNHRLIPAKAGSSAENAGVTGEALDFRLRGDERRVVRSERIML
jgi:hypothetical protein